MLVARGYAKSMLKIISLIFIKKERRKYNENTKYEEIMTDEKSGLNPRPARRRTENAVRSPATVYLLIFFTIIIYFKPFSTQLCYLEVIIRKWMIKIQKKCIICKNYRLTSHFSPPRSHFRHNL